MLSHPQHPEYGQVTISFPIPNDQYGQTIKMLQAIDLGFSVNRDCKVNKVESPYSVLDVIEDTLVNVDQLDYLAKRLYCLEAYGFKRVCFVLSNTLNEMAQPRLVSEEVRKWSQLPWVPPDGKRNRQFAVEASAPQLEALIRQTRTAYQALGLFGPEHCAGDPSKLDYEGKVLVLSPGALRESHWSPRD